MREIRTSGATRGAGELSLLPPTLPPLERQVKPGQSSKKKGACHVKCSYDM